MPARNSLHNIRSLGLRPELRAYEAERAVIEKHVGRYIVQWGYIDMFLGMSIPPWEGRIGPDSSRAAMSRLRTSDKLKRLRAALPDTWLDGQRVLTELARGQEYRNALAHSNLAMSGQSGDKSYGWHFWNVKGRDVRIELDADFMAEQDLHVDVLLQASLALMSDEYLNPKAGNKPNDVSMADLIIAAPGAWDTVEHHEAFKSLARSLFG